METKRKKRTTSTTYTLGAWQGNIIRIKELGLITEEEYEELKEINRKIANRYAMQLIK